MRNTLNHALVVVLALAGLTACAADVGEHGDTLREVDEQAMVGQLLYMRLDVSPFPMTAAELEASGEDATLAIPVRVEIFDEIAVAWFAPGGVARVNRDSIVAGWRVEQRTPIDGELDNNAEIGLVEPGAAPIFLGDAYTEIETPRPGTDQVVTDIPLDAVRSTILDFYNVLNTEAEAAAFVAQIGGYHPGC